MTCKTLQGKYAEKLEKGNEIMNKKINDLYNKLDAQDSIIDFLTLDNSKLKYKIDSAIEEIEHELNGHILIGDETTWNEEYYTDGKLDYKKLLIGILQIILKILGEEK